MISFVNSGNQLHKNKKSSPDNLYYFTYVLSHCSSYDVIVINPITKEEDKNKFIPKKKTTSNRQKQKSTK